MDVEFFTNYINLQNDYTVRVDFAARQIPFLIGLDGWDSLIINRRKPFTYRLFKNFGDVRVCLHKFEECDESEAFPHPHPWPGAFKIISGSYGMNVGRSDNLQDKPHDVLKLVLTAGCSYAITDPLTWHSVTPLGKPCYTVMVNGLPWESHKETRTTKGKDLQKMTEEELSAFKQEYLDQYKSEEIRSMLEPKLLGQWDYNFGESK